MNGTDDAKRLAEMLGDALKKLKSSDNPKTWTAYANLALERFPPVQEAIRSLSSKLAEAKEYLRVEHIAALTLKAALDERDKERDAALAESENWRGHAEGFRSQLGEARAEAEALRADEISWLKSLRDGFVKAVDRRMPAPDYKDVNGDTAIGEAAEKVKDVMRAITVRIKELARLSPPAPAPKHEFAEGGFCNAHMTYGCELESELASAKQTQTALRESRQLWIDLRNAARTERDAALADANERILKANKVTGEAIMRSQASETEARAEAEALKAQDEVHWKTRRSLIKERDAALAEVERWKDDYDEEARACEENARETQEARAEAEVLRAQLDKHHPDDLKAFLADGFKPAPAPAPKVDEERLMENLKDFKTFDNRMHGKPPAPAPKCAKHDTHHFGSDDGGKTVERYGAIPGTNGREPCQDGSAFAKPAPETAKCEGYNPGREEVYEGDHCAKCPDNSERGATVKAVVETAVTPRAKGDEKPGEPSRPPAAENAPCPDHRPELQWVCETCGERTAPTPPGEVR